MKQLRETVEQNGLAKITENLIDLRRGRNYLEVRQVAITRTLKQVEKQLTACEDEEEERELQDLVDNLYAIGSDLEAYRSHLDTELDKVRRGVDMLMSLRGKIGRRAFAAYIAEDTDLSLQDLTQARSYYDQVIETVNKLKDETHR